MKWKVKTSTSFLELNYLYNQNDKLALLCYNYSYCWLGVNGLAYSSANNQISPLHATVKAPRYVHHCKFNLLIFMKLDYYRHNFDKFSHNYV